MLEDVSFDILKGTQEELIEVFQEKNADNGWSDVSLDSVSHTNIENAFKG